MDGWVDWSKGLVKRLFSVDIAVADRVDSCVEETVGNIGVSPSFVLMVVNNVDNTVDEVEGAIEVSSSAVVLMVLTCVEEDVDEGVVKVLD